MGNNNKFIIQYKMKAFMFIVASLMFVSVACKLGDHYPFCLARPPTGGHSLKTLDGLDLNKYYGVWYEQLRMTKFFSYKDRCCTAEYHPLPGNKISVDNKCSSGEGGTATAYAQNGNNATLSVDFDLKSFFSVFAKGNYYVLYLEEGEKQYETVVVGEPCRSLLWVLTRSEKADPAKVQAAVKLAEAQGYDTSKAIYRNTNCPTKKVYSAQE